MKRLRGVRLRGMRLRGMRSVVKKVMNYVSPLKSNYMYELEEDKNTHGLFLIQNQNEKNLFNSSY